MIMIFVEIDDVQQFTMMMNLTNNDLQFSIDTSFLAHKVCVRLHSNSDFVFDNVINRTSNECMCLITMPDPDERHLVANDDILNDFSPCQRDSMQCHIQKPQPDINSKKKVKKIKKQPKIVSLIVWSFA